MHISVSRSFAGYGNVTEALSFLSDLKSFSKIVGSKTSILTGTFSSSLYLLDMAFFSVLLNSV